MNARQALVALLGLFLPRRSLSQTTACLSRPARTGGAGRGRTGAALRARRGHTWRIACRNLSPLNRLEPRLLMSATAAPQTLADLPAAAQQSISSAIGHDQSAYYATTTAAGVTLANPANAFSATVQAGALQVSAGADSWNMTLLAAGYGATAEGAPLGTAQTTASANRVDSNYGPIDAWYINGPAGLEQGFNVAPSTDGSVSLTVTLALGGNLTGVVNAAGDGLALTRPDGSTALGYNGLTVYDATGKALPATLEVQTDGNHQSLLIHVNTAGAQGQITIDPLVQTAKLTASDGAGGDAFGCAVALSGNTVVIGANGASVNSNTSQGAAYVFTESGKGWADMTQTAKLTASDGAAHDTFGCSVAISGSTVVVGALQAKVGSNSNQGAAYVFTESGSAWTNMTETAKLTASDGAANDNFGYSVAISGSTVVAGAYHATVGSNTQQGAAYVFTQPGPGWVNMTQTAKLTASDGAAGNCLGDSIAISGSTVVAGAYSAKIGSNTNQGAAYVFTEPGSAWTNMTQTAKLTASDGAAGDYLGDSIAISGSTVVAGAYNAKIGSNTNQGAAYVFTEPGSAWTNMTQTAKLTSSDGAASDTFGISVAISGNTVVVGAYGVTVNGHRAQGAAYEFTESGSGWFNMTETAKLTASDGLSFAGFCRVAVSGSTVAVGALGATIHGIDQGAAYVFTDSATDPTVTTPTDTSITATTATLGGNVTSDGGATITARGVVYALTSVNSNPQIGGTGVTEVDDAASTTGVFTEAITGLTASTGYSYVAFATNSAGTTYTNPVTTFTTPSPPASLGTSALLEGPAGGADSDLVMATGAWSAAANDTWLHSTASGTDNGLATFTVDANTGATRTGSLTVAGQTLTVTQAGSSYVAASPVTVVSAGLNRPFGLAVDNAGNVYIADYANNAIKEWNAATQTVSTLVSTGLNLPRAVAVDNAGNVYIADSSNAALEEWVAATQTVQTLVSTGLYNPTGVAVDSAGNVYIADQANGTIEKWDAVTQTLTTFNDTLQAQTGVAFDQAGNLYVAEDGGTDTIVKLDATTYTAHTLVSTGLNTPMAIAVDATGNVYIADTYNAALKVWNPVTQAVRSVVSAGLSSLAGVAVNSAGDVYIADTMDYALKVLPRAFVPGAALGETALAGSDQLLPVLSATQSLTGVFAPTSDQPWLTVGTPNAGVIPFSFTQNTGAARTANITVLGQQIAVNQDAGTAATQTAVTAAQPSATYGTALTFTATVAASAGSAAPSQGNVDFTDTTTGHDFGNGTFGSSSGTNATWTLAVTASAANALHVTAGDVFTATYTAGKGFTGSSGTVTQILTPAPLTITASTDTKVYDGTTAATATPIVSGLVGTDTVTGLTEAYTSKDVLGTNGSTTVVTGYTVNDGNSGNDYTVTTATARGTITPAGLTISATTNTKVYDGTTSASATPSVSGLVGTDTVTGLTEAYTSKDVKGANGSTAVVTSYTVNDGNSGNDYTVTTATAAGTITPAALTITASGDAKTYDGENVSWATPNVLGLLGSDTATGLAEAYASKDVLGANGSTLVVTGYTVNDGNSGNDYTVTTATAAGTIGAKSLLLVAAYDVKVYDGTTASSATPTVLGVVGSDTVTGVTEAFASKDVQGDNRSVLDVTAYTVNDGNQGNDYTVYTTTQVGTITPAALTITAATDAKVYDGTTSATATPSVSGLAGTDTVTGLTEAYASKDVLGLNSSELAITGYTVNDGNSGSDYTVATATAAGTITPASSTISAATDTKVYDTTTSATATPSVSGLLGTDTVTGLTEAYTSKDVKGPNGSTAVVTGYTVNDGNSGNDYTVTTATAAGTITPAPLTVTVTALDKVYTSTTQAHVSLLDNRLGTDDLSLTYMYATFADKNVGTAKTVTVNGLTINGGADAGNYTLGNTSATTTATITKATLTVTATGINKVYDGTAPATVTLLDNRLGRGLGLALLTPPLGRDQLTLTYNATFDTPNAGTAKTVSVTGIAITGGADAGNYTLGNTTTTTTANITPAPLTITADNQTKVYGAALPTLTASYSGLVNGETSASLTTLPALSTPATATSAVSGSPYTITAAGAVDGNYTISYTNGALTITPAALTITANNQTKIYGATLPTLTASYAGFVNGDNVASLTTSPTVTTTATAASPVSGGPYPITATGAVDSNYTITYAPGYLAISQNITSAILVTSADPAAYLAPVTFTAVIASAGPAATGLVTFSEGSTVLGTGMLDAQGHASFTTSNLFIGSHWITAAYAGDAQWVGSTSMAINQLIGTPSQRYVELLYADLLHRQADLYGMNIWAGMLDSGQSYQSVAKQFANTPEYDTDVTTNLYVTCLGRQPDAPGLALRIAQMQEGMNAMEIQSILLGSPEFFARAGGNNSGYVTALYQVILQRNPDPLGLGVWPTILNTGQDTIGDVAQRIAYSDESLGLVINSLYQTYLNRAADPLSLTTYKSLLANGIAQNVLLADFVASPEFLRINNIV